MSLFLSSQFKSLYQQTMPMLIGLFAIMGCQLVDSAFIGQLGANPLAVIGYSIPIYQLIVGVQVGIGIAITASISISLGENKQQYAKHLAAISLTIGSLVIFLLCLLLWFFQREIVGYLGADTKLLNLISLYWLPWLISCWLGALLYFGYSICRSHGQTLIPGKVMVITSVINMALDPIFIFGLDLGIAGAAWATNLSFIVGLIIIFKAIKAKAYIAFPDNFKMIKACGKALSKFTAPAMLSQFIPPVSAILVTMIVASFGNAAIGAWGLANRIEYLSIILILAITMALPPMIGKLKGKGDYQEIFKLVKVTNQFIILFQGVMAVMLIALSPLSALLTNQSEVAILLEQYLWLVPVSYGSLGICMICVSACNAIGAPTSALITSIVRLFICYLPFVWLGAQFYGLTGIFIGACVGNLFSGNVGWQVFLKEFKRALAVKPKAETLNYKHLSC